MCYDVNMIKFRNFVCYLLISFIFLIFIACNSKNSIESTDTVRPASFAMSSAPAAPALMKATSFESSDNMNSNIDVTDFNGLVMNIARLPLTVSLVTLLSVIAEAQDDIASLNERGRELYFERVSCWVCHGDDAEGRVGPTLQHGPTPMDIQEQLESNPQMGVIVAEMDPTDEDLVALATYLGGLDGDPIDPNDIPTWREQLIAMAAARGPEVEFLVTERDRKVMEIQSFETVLAEWPRRAKNGSLQRSYEVRVLETYVPGEPVFKPEPGRLYF